MVETLINSRRARKRIEEMGFNVDSELRFFFDKMQKWGNKAARMHSPLLRDLHAQQKTERRK